MSLDKIIQRITKDAESKAAGIIRDAEAQAEDVLSQGRLDAQGIIEKMERDYKKRGEGMKKKMLSAARREVRHMEMQAKEEVILECFAQAQKSLGSLGGRDYGLLVEKLISQAKPLVKTGVVVPSRDEDGVIAQKLGMTVAPKKISAMGGVIVREEDGSMEIDNTFEGLLKRKRDDIRVKIAKSLFK